MANDQTSTIILQVKLDESDTEKQLAQIVLGIEATRKAQAELNTARKAGKVTDEEFAAQTVKLKAELKAQQTEQTALTKNLDLYRKASGDLGNTYAGVQAQLSLAQNQFKLLDGSQDNSSESAKELTGIIDGLRNKLKETDAQQSLFARNIGNYPTNDSLENLIRQMVKLEEETKRGTLTTEEANRAQMQIAGFRTQAMQAAAKEGKTYEETTNLIKGYSAAIRPAVANLVALEQEQQKVAEGSEAFNQIGFKIQQAGKQIKQVPTEVKGVAASITDLDGTTGVFGGRVAGLKNQFTQAKQGIELARAGFTGLKGAIAATGIGLLILTLASLYEYFTKTDEGAEDLAAGMAYLKGIVSVLESVLISTGKALVSLFKEPKKTALEFADFIGNNLLNRVKAFGVLWESIKNGDSTKFQDSIVQFTTGIENATAKTRLFAAEMKSAAETAASLSRAKDELDDLERGEIVRTEKYRNEIERLVLTAKDRTLTEKERLANLERAGKLETTVLENTTNLARQRLSIIERENFEAAKTGKLSDEQKKAAADAEADIVRLVGQSASLQQSIQNRRSVLLQQIAADAKTAAADAEAVRKKKDEDMLKSIEADIAAGLSREAAAAKYLDEQLKGDQVRLASAEKARAEDAAANEAAYQRDLKMLERNLDERRVKLETEYAAGQATKEQYEGRLTVIDEGGYSARLLLAKQHNKDISAADAARTRFHNAELLKQTEKERGEYQQRIQVAKDFGAAVGTQLAQTLAESGASLEDFAGKFLLLVLDMLEKQVMAGQVGILINSLATKGLFGLVEAAALTATIQAAFGVVKSVISAGTSKQFAAGGVLQGATHAQGGIPFTVDGRPGFEAEHNEVLLTRGVWDSPILRPVANWLNIAGGGAPLLPRTHMALGGVATTQAAGLLRGGVDAGLDYNRLAQAMSQIKVKATIQDVQAGLDRKAFTNQTANS